MKKITFKTLLFFGFMLCSLGITAQDAPPSDDIFRLKNVETGLFLTDTGTSATAVTMTDLVEEDQSTHFTFVQSGAFYNIDSEILGILRAPGAGGPGGPYVVVGTTTASPAADADKVWTIQHNQTDDTYRFQSGNSGRYMYHDANGTVTHVVIAATDNRSNWELVPFVVTPVETAPDEDTNPDLTCPASGEFQNDNTRNVDIPNADNVGTVDDRTCYADYYETNVYGETWGAYNITDGSNHWDTPGTLQPRIERSLPRSQETGVGSYARFTGTLRILEVGDTGSFGTSGSYLMQSKGKHTGGGGPPDPAICLYLARPVYGDDGNGNQVQVSFDIWREQINFRGGSGSAGRTNVFLKNVLKDEIVDIELEVGFREDPNDPDLKIHYSDAVIGGEAFNWDIPEPERGTESGIRYGAYRVRGGRAQMRWANTTYEKVDVPDTSGPPPSDDIYRLRNMETGQFLTDVGSGATPVVMSDSGEEPNKHWTFQQSGSFINIDSETFGALRATGANFAAGAYIVVSTGASSPNSDSDKTWILHYNETEDTYRFESRTSGRYLYHETDGNVYHLPAAESDMRSVWEAIPTSQTLSIDNNELSVASIKVYPNPANTNFTIALNNSIDADVTIYTMLGKVVYKGGITNGKIKIRNNGNLTSGLYIVSAITDDNKTVQTKLIIN